MTLAKKLIAKSKEPKAKPKPLVKLENKTKFDKIRKELYDSLKSGMSENEVYIDTHWLSNAVVTESDPETLLAAMRNSKFYSDWLPSVEVMWADNNRVLVGFEAESYSCQLTLWFADRKQIVLDDCYPEEYVNNEGIFNYLEEIIAETFDDETLQATVILNFEDCPFVSTDALEALELTPEISKYWVEYKKEIDKAGFLIVSGEFDDEFDYIELTLQAKNEELE
jgi:hypothetical protein